MNILNSSEIESERDKFWDKRNFSCAIKKWSRTRPGTVYNASGVMNLFFLFFVCVKPYTKYVNHSNINTFVLNQQDISLPIVLFLKTFPGTKKPLTWPSRWASGVSKNYQRKTKNIRILCWEWIKNIFFVINLWVNIKRGIKDYY